MAIEPRNDTFVDDSNNMELYKMKNELTMFVAKMKSKGYLESVDYPTIPEMYMNEHNSWE